MSDEDRSFGRLRHKALRLWLQFTLWVHERIEDGFEVLGKFAARHPIRLILITLAAGALCVALIFTHGEYRADFELWVPKGSPSLKDQNHYNALFQYAQEQDTHQFNVLVQKKGGGSLLEDTVTLKQAMELYSAINKLTIKRKGDGKRIGILDVCHRPYLPRPDLCQVTTGLMAWKDATSAKLCQTLLTSKNCTYALDPSLLDADFASGGKSALLDRINNRNGDQSDFFGGALGPLTVAYGWGDITWDDESSLERSSVDVGGIFMQWVVDASRLSDKELKALALAFENTLERGKLKGRDIKNERETTIIFGDRLDYTYLAPGSIDREFFAGSLDSGPTLAMGTVLMILFATLTLGKFNGIEGRKAVAICSVIDTWIATGSAFGICMFLGYPYTPFSQIVPFLALGLGVDDAFIIVAALEHTDKNASLEDRFGEALKKAGASITLTSLTDFIAFSVGSISPIPAMRFFCFHMAWAILFDLVFQCTFFVACLVIDEERILKRRLDCCCCIPPLNKIQQAKLSSRDDAIAIDSGDEGGNTRAIELVKAQNDGKADKSSHRVHTEGDHKYGLVWAPLTWLVEEKLVPLLDMKWFAVVALFFAAFFLAAGIHGMVAIRVNFGYKDVLMPDSFALKFLDRFLDKFATEKLGFNLILDTSGDAELSPAQGMDYQKFQTQTLSGLSVSMTDLKYVDRGPLAPNWLDLYEEWLACTPCCARQCYVCSDMNTEDTCNSCATSCQSDISDSASLSVASFHTHLSEMLVDIAYGGTARDLVAYSEACTDVLRSLVANESRSVAEVDFFGASCRPTGVRWKFAYDTSSNGYPALEEDKKANVVVHIRGKVKRADSASRASVNEYNEHVKDMFAIDDDWINLDLYILLRELVVKSIFLVALCVIIVGGIMLIHPTLAFFM